MSEELIRQIVRDEMTKLSLSSLSVPFHKHTLTDAGQLDASQCLINSPQPKITAATAGSLSSGGDAVLTDEDSTIITNAITRIADLENRFSNQPFVNLLGKTTSGLGLLTHS